MAAYPAYQWRADGGYQQPPPLLPPLYTYAPPPPMYFPPPVQYMPGPVGIWSISQQAPATLAPQHQVSVPAPPPLPVEKEEKKDCRCLPPPPPKKEEADKKSEASKEAVTHRSNLRAPPSLMPGENYMFASSHLKVHIFKRASKLWLPKYKGQRLEFKIFKVDTMKTVRQMIEYVLSVSREEGAERCKGWAATEMIELGAGDFTNGTTLEYTADRSKSTFEACGWNSRRGRDLPPVWIAVHKT